MSVQAIASVLAHSRSQGAARIVAFVLANHANSTTGLAWPGMTLLMAEANLSERSVRRALAELVDLGEIADAGEVHGARAWTVEVDCPPACDGTGGHVVVQRRAIDAQRRASERRRKQVQRAGLDVADRDAGEVVEGVVEELSRPDWPGQNDSGTPDRSVVPARLTGTSRPDWPGQGGLSLIREPEVETTTTSEPRTAAHDRGSSKKGAAAAAGAAAGATAGGGAEDVDQALAAVQAALPSALRISVARSSLKRALESPLGRGMTAEAVEQAVRARSWAGAGAGALIVFVRDLEPEPPRTTPQMVRSWCPLHVEEETTRGQCGRCREEGVRRREASGAVRRPGESTADFLTRLARDAEAVAPPPTG